MAQRDWRSADVRLLGAFVNGKELQTRGPQGEPVVDDDFVLLFNANHAGAEFTLPPRRFGRRWRLVLSTVDPAAEEALFPARGLVPVEALSSVVLQGVG
jgi:glycogen operon protein